MPLFLKYIELGVYAYICFSGSAFLNLSKCRFIGCFEIKTGILALFVLNTPFEHLSFSFFIHT